MILFVILLFIYLLLKIEPTKSIALRILILIALDITTVCIYSGLCVKVCKGLNNSEFGKYMCETLARDAYWLNGFIYGALFVLLFFTINVLIISEIVGSKKEKSKDKK